MSIEQIALGVLAALSAAVVALFRLWRGAETKARNATRRANTHEEMRDHENEASQMDDTSLANRLTRKP